MRVSRGEDDDRDLDPVVAEFLQHGESVASGESEVEHDQVERARPAGGQGFVAVFGDGRGVAIGGEALDDERGDAGFVFCDQDATHHVCCFVVDNGDAES